MSAGNKSRSQGAATRWGWGGLIWPALLLLSLFSTAQAAQPTARPGELNRFWLDDTPPEVTLESPENDSAVSDPLTPIQFLVVDPLQWGFISSLLDVSSVQFTLNGTDLSDQVVVESLGLPIPWLPPRRVRVTYTPTADDPLPEGIVSLSLSMADRAGNVGSFSGQIRLDTQPPEIVPLAPTPETPITDLLTPLTYQVTDGVGVDPDTLAVTINGAGRTDGVSLENDQLTITAPTEGWAPGNLAVGITVADQLGHSTTVEFAYTVVTGPQLAAYPRAVPSSGEAPLAVTFVPDVVTSTAIELYEWDFEGDGTFDRSETVGRNQSFTFTTPGVYDTKLRITDTLDEQAVGTVRVTVGNAPPVVTAEASPSNGAPPLAVTFTATATDNNGIATYEWDFEGDGTYDTSGPGNTATHTYTGAGVFQPRVRVTDTLGAATELAVPTIEVRVTDGAPTVAGSASPTTGNAPLTVSFNATATDPQGQAITEWAWDFDGDGAYDHTSASAAVTHSYTAPATYYARVRATTADGRTGIDVVKVTVNLTLALRVLDDTIDPGLGETTTIETTLGGDTEVSLVLENRGGSTVRTLVPWGVRPAGTYSDSWDGFGDDDALLPESDYRAILLYRIDGQEKRFDLSLTTGGVQSNPPRSGIPSRFAPFAGNPLRITYTLGKASEVTAFMGRYNVDARLITFLQRDPRGRGTHEIVWHGENADGQLAHPPLGDSFLFGIFAYTLPDNAIFVRSGVHASGLTAEPAIYDPTQLTDQGAAAESTLHFTLNRAGSVELIVIDAESGRQILAKQITGIAAGEQTVAWNGRDDQDVLAAPGRYRIGITGIDDSGARSTTVYTLQRVFY